MKNHDALRKAREVLEVNLEHAIGRATVIRHAIRVLRNLESLFKGDE